MNKSNKELEKKINEEIDGVLGYMNNIRPDTEQYQTAASNLEKLYRARDIGLSRKVKPETIAVVAGNLLGIVIILGYEQKHVISSKALGFVMKGRV